MVRTFVGVEGFLALADHERPNGRIRIVAPCRMLEGQRSIM
jgi:hypothetical protein